MKCALIGERLGHSYSKLIHEAFGLYSYELVSLPKDKVGEFMENEEFDAFNVTIPYKRTVMPYCSYISPEAQKIGSVNTVVRTSDGLHGFNTDYFGFKSMAERAGIDFAGKKVVILGSGGTSLTARAVASDGGAERITVVSRSGDSLRDSPPRGRWRAGRTDRADDTRRLSLRVLRRRIPAREDDRPVLVFKRRSAPSDKRRLGGHSAGLLP